MWTVCGRELQPIKSHGCGSRQTFKNYNSTRRNSSKHQEQQATAAPTMRNMEIRNTRLLILRQRQNQGMRISPNLQQITETWLQNWGSRRIILWQSKQKCATSRWWHQRKQLKSRYQTRGEDKNTHENNRNEEISYYQNPQEVIDHQCGFW